MSGGLDTFWDQMTPVRNRVERLYQDENESVWGASQDWGSTPKGTKEQDPVLRGGSSGWITRGEVLEHASRRSVEDDVRTVVQVMQVVATVESPVAKHVVESQLLRSHTEIKAALRGSKLRGTNPHSGSSHLPHGNCMAGQTANSPQKAFCFLTSWGYNTALSSAPWKARETGQHTELQGVF